jgi:hypothetical protein
MMSESAMQYLLLIYEDEKKSAAMSEAETAQLFADYMAFTRYHQENELDRRAGAAHPGAERAGRPLAREEKVQLVAVRADGTFAEATQLAQVGGQAEESPSFEAAPDLSRVVARSSAVDYESDPVKTTTVERIMRWNAKEGKFDTTERLTRASGSVSRAPRPPG